MSTTTNTTRLIDQLTNAVMYQPMLHTLCEYDGSTMTVTLTWPGDNSIVLNDVDDATAEAFKRAIFSSKAFDNAQKAMSNYIITTAQRCVEAGRTATDVDQDVAMSIYIMLYGWSLNMHKLPAKTLLDISLHKPYDIT